MRWILVLLLAVGAAVTAAGCFEDGGYDPDYELNGTYTEDASQEQMQQLSDEVDQRGGDIVHRETFPVRFLVTMPDRSGCEEVRSFAAKAAYVGHVDECEPDHVPEDR